MKSRQKGFTLLEVLLASFILFIVLAGMTMVYRGALLSSRIAERSIDSHQIVGFATADIKNRLSSGINLTESEVAGAGQVNGVKYSWTGKNILDKKGQSILNPDGDFSVPSTRYQNWEIQLTLQINNYQKTLNYRLFRWQEK
ncbi:PulJ/GspJ family protein [Shewanella donghaensis]|uniref:PulJ/GspJ family protein n=1 Tax=Shewanella donghaensis TaxID=238836 RepID=UPI0011842AF5|nr:prepilin-type N-terminal cleavage/methylation domain-containing protein [Shewanella donghaensis]